MNSGLINSSQLDSPLRIQFPSSTISTPGAVRKKKILVVDDSVIILKALSMKLQSRGYDVLTAVDGGGAVSSVRREKPDLILLDINFPPDVAHGGGVPWDGFLIMNWLRRMDEAADIPIIIITGAEPVLYKDRCIAAGVAGYFRKPIDHEQLLLTIQKLLGTGDKVDPNEPERNPRVLFVDDENDWRFMATIYLKDSGYDVATAATGAEAETKVAGMKPDLIILDLNLAGESGMDVMQRLKSICPEAPILLYTGCNHDEAAVGAMLQQGAHRYLRKGTMGEMLNAVQNALASFKGRNR